MVLFSYLMSFFPFTKSLLASILNVIINSVSPISMFALIKLLLPKSILKLLYAASQICFTCFCCGDKVALLNFRGELLLFLPRERRWDGGRGEGGEKEEKEEEQRR